MKQMPIGFRELLERVLPLDQLPPPDRLMIQRALTSGFVSQLEAAGLHAIERLEDRGVLKRLPTSSNGGSQVVRYQPEGAFEIITIELPGPTERDRIVSWPRASLPARASTGLDQVRQLLRLDEVGVLSEPGGGRTRPMLFGQLDLAGREILGATSVRFFTGNDDELASADPPVEPAMITVARARSGTLFYCPDTTQSRRLDAPARARGVQSIAWVSVVNGSGEALGCLEVRCERPDPYQPADLARLLLLADTCGSVLERAARLEKLVFVDAMTGAYNRTYFEQQAVNEMARAEREKSSLALCIVDIDDFKSFNSAYGYEAGNQVLTGVSQALTHAVRPFDTVARWGGEEFAVLLTSPVLAEDVVMISERLRSAVQRMELEPEGLDRRAHRVRVTVSIGVALFPDHARTTPDLWRVANQALLEAKRPPKNQVVFFRARAGGA